MRVIPGLKIETGGTRGTVEDGGYPPMNQKDDSWTVHTTGYLSTRTW
jgi:hypothetical protein